MTTSSESPAGSPFVRDQILKLQNKKRLEIEIPKMALVIWRRNAVKGGRQSSPTQRAHAYGVYFLLPGGVEEGLKGQGLSGLVRTCQDLSGDGMIGDARP